jgi:hypothetical protein
VGESFEEDLESLETDGPDEGTAGTRLRAEAREEDLAGNPAGHPAAPDELLRTRLSSRRPYWLATMRQIGTICALTLSILSAGYRLEWDPAT